ncbi:Serum response factor like, partial [Pseudolycoriella hygida]
LHIIDGYKEEVKQENNATLVRPPSGLGQSMNRSGGLMGPNTQCNNMSNSRGIKRTSSDCFDDRAMGSQSLTLDGCTGNVNDVVDDGFTSLQKKSPPANGKKTKGRVKIKMEYIDNKLRRYTTFSKRKTGIMKKAYELSTLTGTQVMLLVASETGHVYTFATRKLQPMITSEAGKQLIQTCLNSPDPPSGATTGDQRMSATGFEETELSYNIGDEDSKDDRSPMSSGESGDESSGIESPGPIGAVPGSIGGTNSNNMGSLLYPAAALANLPQEVLLSLVQGGHLQIHQEDDGAHQYITIPLSMMPGGLSKVTAIKESAVTNGRESPNEVIIKKENIE